MYIIPYFFPCRRLESIKIGYALNAKRRLSQIQTALAYPIEMVACVPASRLTEKRLHEYLRGYRQNGEWFELNPTILAIGQGMEAIADYETCAANPEHRQQEIDKVKALGKRLEDYWNEKRASQVS